MNERFKANGERLRRLRGMTPMREVIDGLGISQSALSMYEHGNRNPSDKVKIRLAQYYGVSVESIFWPEDNTKSVIKGA